MDTPYYRTAKLALETYQPYVSGERYDKSVSSADLMLLHGGGNCFAFTEAVGAAMLENPDTKRVIVTLRSVMTNRRRALHTACTAISHQNESLLIDFYEDDTPKIDPDIFIIHNKIQPERTIYSWSRRGSDTLRTVVRTNSTMSEFRWPKNTLAQRVYIDYHTALPMLRSIALLEGIKTSGGEEAFEKARAKHALPRLPRR